MDFHCKFSWYWRTESSNKTHDIYSSYRLKIQIEKFPVLKLPILLPKILPILKGTKTKKSR